MKCPLCMGDLKKGFTTLTFDKMPQETIVIKQVPADICEQCGESFIDIQVTKKVEEMVKKAEKNGLKMGFLEFDSAA